MSNNQYENFKQGVKTDIKTTVWSLYLIGGLFLLVIAMVTALFVAVKAYRMDMTVRVLLGFGVVLLAGVMIFNRKALNLILGVWLILLVAVVVLPILFLMGYFIYTMFKQPYYND